MMISLERTSLGIHYRALELSLSVWGIQDDYHCYIPVLSEKCHLKLHEALLSSQQSKLDNIQLYINTQNSADIVNDV